MSRMEDNIRHVYELIMNNWLINVRGIVNELEISIVFGVTLLANHIAMCSTHINVWSKIHYEVCTECSTEHATQHL